MIVTFFVQLLLEFGLYALQGFFYFFILGTEADTYISFSVTAKDEAWGDKHTGVMQHAFGQFFGVGITIGYASPQKHAHL